MSNESLDKKNEILLIKEEIKKLEKKKRQLRKLEFDYYKEYFNTDREDYALLTDIPDNPTNKYHILYDYSALNVDTIGKIICELFKKYENKKIVSKRLVKTEISDNIFHDFHRYPILVIGSSENIHELDHNEDNIVIEYDHVSLDEYPSNHPVYEYKDDYQFKWSNYNKLIGYYEDLKFDYNKHEFIEELIYSLAYYQKVHDIKFMSPQETWNVYRKIFKK